MPLSAQEMKQFVEDGYVVLKGVMPESELGRFRVEFERTVEVCRANPKEEYGVGFVHGSEGKKEPWRSNSMLHPDLYQPVYTDFLDNERLLTSVQSIVGPNLRIGGLKILWSPLTLTYDLHWHRDGRTDQYVPDGTQDYLQFNAALNPDSSFRIVPGTHRRPLNDVELEACRRGVGPLPGELVCPLEPGDVLFMHSRALHRGKADPTSNRRSFHYTLSAAEKPVRQGIVDEHRQWYRQLGLEGKLSARVQALFDNLFAWDGKELTEQDLARAAY
ncbi:MAG: phytanoyl-CoA dioxygenase family protein [Phycisphaeraceae bacterium]|nr:phytanoyl-CoA dioxygenase family protein [Phycisphaeraceae bacterium]